MVHVGESFDILTMIQHEGRRASGEKVPTYPGFMRVEDRSVARESDGGVIGLQPGRTRIVLTVMRRNAHAPPSYVPFIVIP